MSFGSDAAFMSNYFITVFIKINPIEIKFLRVLDKIKFKVSESNNSSTNFDYVD